MFDNKEIANLKLLFNVGYRSALPINCLPSHLPKRPKGRLIILSFGKAGLSMAKVAEKHYGPNIEGCAVAPIACNHYNVPLKYLKVIFASHPTPNIESLEAGQALLNCVKNLNSDDLVLFLISGGGSSLLCMPKKGISLEDKISITKSLLYSGASIAEINLVRRHLSAIKGGKLAISAYPANCISLAISDVPDNNPLTIASGPTVHDTSKISEALKIIHKYKIKVSHAVLNIFKFDFSRNIYFNNLYIIIANSNTMLKSSMNFAKKLNYQVKLLGDDLEGEAKKLGELHGIFSLLCQKKKSAVSAPLLLLSGGETSVTVRNKYGVGGRNTEYLLALAIKVNGRKGIFACSADSDGIDGASKSAGAFIDPNTLNNLKLNKLDANNLLQNNNSWAGFHAINSLINIGPTGTNVNDFRAILIK